MPSGVIPVLPGSSPVEISFEPRLELLSTTPGRRRHRSGPRARSPWGIGFFQSFCKDQIGLF